MFYIKNLPWWERLLRGAVGIAAMAYALSGNTGLWDWLILVGGTMIILTAVFGFCPACALAGRRLQKRSQSAQR